jgi:adenylate cyclase
MVAQPMPLSARRVFDRLLTLRQSIRRKIVGVAVALIFLMVVTSVLSMFMSATVAHLLDELTNRYIPAYGHLSRANVRSLERALALRRMVIAKLQVPPDEEAYKTRRKTFEEKDTEVAKETDAARRLINAIIADTATPSDNAALARIEVRIVDATEDLRQQLGQEDVGLLAQLDARDFAAANRTLGRVDVLRDHFIERIDQIRSDMLAQVYASTATVISGQKQTMIVSAVLTALAAALGLTLALIVASGIARPVMQLLAGAREVEAGRLDQIIAVSTRDEIGELSAAFNSMVEQLRRNERIRETFGRYIDPKVVEGLIDRPDLTPTEGQRRVMTVLFCDMKGFTPLSEGMTPQGLVKVVNCYLSTMSEPIRDRRGIIDKYIGDAIMAYWGPPFVEGNEQAALACHAALDMIGRVPELQRQIPELLGLRAIPLDCDVRIGIATGEVLSGSIGSQFMMSFTVMGDAVNLASRLEAVNKVYNTRLLVSQDTAAALAAAFETRQVDRIAVVGQTMAQAVYEVMARAGGLSAEQESLRTHYADGLAAYRARDWAAARRAFGAALEAVPGDGPSQALLERIAQFETHPPPPDWDGAWQMEHK